MLGLPSDQTRRKPVLGARLNRGHPLANGLIGAWLFNEGSGGTRNLAGTTDDLANINASWTVTSEGVAGRVVGWVGFKNTTPSLLLQPAYLKTVFWQGMILGDVSVGLPDAPPLFAHYYDASGTAPYNCGSIHRYNNNADVLFAWNNGTFNSQTVTGLISAYSTPIQLALVLDGASVLMYKDGSLASTSFGNVPTAGSPILYGAANYQTFGIHPSANVDANAAASLMLEWNRALSQQELQALVEESYALFTSRYYWLIPPAGGTNYTRSAVGTEPAPTGTLTRLRVRSLVGTEPAATGTLTRRLQAVRALTGAEPSASGALTRVLQALRALTGAEPAASGVLTRIRQRFRTLTGAQPAPTATLAAQKITARTVAGSQPAETGVLTRKLQAVRALDGAQPAESGALTRRLQALRTLTGAEPYSTATLTATLQGAPTRSMAGQEPAATGTLTTQHQSFKVLTGAQPAPTGTLTRVKNAVISLAGAEPNPSAVLTRQLIATRVLVGSEPTSTAVLQRRASLHLLLTGVEPYPSGGLAGLTSHNRVLAGLQPFPSGVLIGQSMGSQAISAVRILKVRSTSFGLSAKRSTDFILTKENR
jgi:hypothetical protein